MMDKKAARKTAAERRALAQTPEHQSALTQALVQAVLPFRGKAIAAYMPIRSEADPLAGLAHHDGPLALPVIIEKGAPLQFRLWQRGEALVEGAFGALIPEKGEFIRPDLVIVPLLAFDLRGYRLGYGGGFYDRTLAQLRDQGPLHAMGLAFSGQEMEALPIEATDEPLDSLLTEKGLRLFNGALR